MALFSKTKTKKNTGVKSRRTAQSRSLRDVAPSMKELYSVPAAAVNQSATGKAGASGRNFSESYRVIVAPLITEKATQAGTHNQYIFTVAKDANKIMVARAVEAIYGVKPAVVNIMNVLGKTKRSGRVTGRRKDWKKAIVSLPAGTKIQVYEGV